MPRAGLEPATSRSSVSHSPKLSYRGAKGANGGREKRVSPGGEPDRTEGVKRGRSRLSTDVDNSDHRDAANAWAFSDKRRRRASSIAFRV